MQITRSVFLVSLALVFGCSPEPEDSSMSGLRCEYLDVAIYALFSSYHSDRHCEVRVIGYLSLGEEGSRLYSDHESWRQSILANSIVLETSGVSMNDVAAAGSGVLVAVTGRFRWDEHGGTGVIAVSEIHEY